jgi:hypothetical protein
LYVVGENKPSFLQNVASVASIASAVAVPFLVVLIQQGRNETVELRKLSQEAALGDRSLKAEYVGVAVGILSQEPRPSDQQDRQLREWALAIIKEYAPLPLPSSAAARALRAPITGPTNDATSYFLEDLPEPATLDWTGTYYRDSQPPRLTPITVSAVQRIAGASAIEIRFAFVTDGREGVLEVVSKGFFRATISGESFSGNWNLRLATVAGGLEAVVEVPLASEDRWDHIEFRAPLPSTFGPHTMENRPTP